MCPKCGVEQPVAAFSKSKDTKDGLQTKCKACAKRWREDNKEKVIVGEKRYDRSPKRAHDFSRGVNLAVCT